MKYSSSIVVATAVLAAITFSNLKTAYGELVLEDASAQQAVSGETIRSTSVDSGDISAKTESRIKESARVSDSTRNQRIQEEMKNEDRLTQKLEELRLQDELKRQEQVLAATLQASKPTQSNATAQSVAQVKEESESSFDSMKVSVTPRGGLSTISNSLYNIESKYAFGLGMSVDITDHFTITGGYTYASYSLAAGNAVQFPSSFNGSLQQLNFNDNIFDLGVRGNLLGTRSRVRPFIGTGLAYRRGFVNYDERTRDIIRRFDPNGIQDVNISGFAGYLEGGLEFKITPAFGIVGSARYFHVLSSQQSTPVSPYAFYNGTPNYGGNLTSFATPGTWSNDARVRASDSLASDQFFQLMLGVSVTF
jgi:hypothetical protein